MRSAPQDHPPRRRALVTAVVAGLAAAAGACTTPPPGPGPPTTTTTATTTTTVAPTTSGPPAPVTGEAGIVAVIGEAFGDLAPEAVRIARCESGLRPTAVSPTDDHGLFQINVVHRADFIRVTGRSWGAVYDALTNARYARWLHDRQGWAPWAPCAHVLGPAT